MMISDNFRMAWNSLRSSRLRSFLTMLGIIIGVASVVTTVSLGEGVKRQVAGQLNQLGSDLITIRPGRSSSNALSSVNVFSDNVVAGSLNEHDIETIRKTEGVKHAVPLSVVTGEVKTAERSYDKGLVIGTSHELSEVINRKVEFGNFFGSGDSSRHVAIIGTKVAEDLFQEAIPMGKTMQIRGQDFQVRGVLENFETSPLTPGTNFNEAIFIPYESGKAISSDAAPPIYEILAKPTDAHKAQATIGAINDALKSAHKGETDFTVLNQQDSLAITNSVVLLITSLISGIAAVSLLVGGIGIMNVMLVSVSERTREIGIRKAIGATSRQIRTQFLIEAVVLSIWGAVIGMALAGLVNLILRITTDLQPVITWQVVAIAGAVSLVVGIVFGVTPAFKAARKDPIEALRGV
jgi:putative ABC transport system permease protein